MNALLSSALAALLLSSPALAGSRWTLDFTPTRVGTVTVRGAQGPGTYLYMVCKVENKNDGTVPARLSLAAATDVAGRSYRGGFDPTVKSAVERRLGRELKSLHQSRADLASGNSVEFVVSFGKVDPNVDLFKISIHGLVDRVYGDQYKVWFEDKTLRLTYKRSGDEFYRPRDLLRLTKREWQVLAPRREVPRR